MLYIDQDEEITSIVGRVRAESVTEVILLVPPRSLLLSSIVNLKLLAREAKRATKRVVIASQDETGLALAKKAGIAVRSGQGVLDLDRASLSSEEASPKSHSDGAFRKKRGMDMRPPEPIDSLNGVHQVLSTPVPVAVKDTPLPVKGTPKVSPDSFQKIFSDTNNLAEHAAPEDREKKFHEEFRSAVPQVIAVSRRLKIALGIFSIFGAVLLAGAASWSFLPNAEVFISPQTIVAEDDFSFPLSGAPSHSEEGAMMIIVEKTVEKERVSDATGASGSGGQRASGTVIIYNEYSADSQPLVATTRLLAPDGKLFRIAKSVVVPGMRTEEGKQVPGSVSVEVKADEAGEEYNIAPTTFSIPGFEGTAKYEKFSAKSEEPFFGGALGSGTPIVSDADIARARSALVEEAKQEAIAQMLSDAAPDAKLLEDTIIFEITNEDVVPAIGSVSPSFRLLLSVRFRAALFYEANIYGDIEDALRARAETQSPHVPWRSDPKIVLEYGATTMDYEEGMGRVSLHAAATFTAAVDEKSVRDDLRAAGSGEVQSILDDHPEIEKIHIEFWPSFVSQSLPKRTSRIEVKVER